MVRKAHLGTRRNPPRAGDITLTARLVMKFAADLCPIMDGASLRLQRDGRELVLPITSAGQRVFWHSFCDGADADARKQALGQLPAADRFALVASIETLRRGSWIVEELFLGDRLVLTRTVISDWFEPTPVDPAQAYGMSRFALLRSDSCGLMLESPRCHARLTVAAHSAGRCAALLATGVAPGWDRDPETAAIVRMLAECGLLVARFPDQSSAEDQDANLREWEFHDLLFHARSRAGRHRDPYGKSNPAPQSELPTPEALRPAPDRIVLALPDARDVARRDPSFDSVLEGRRTVRTAPEHPLTLATLAEFLFRSARIQRSDDGSPAGAWRPFASAAGRNELELYLSVHSCTGLTPGLFRYDAVDHALDPIAMSDQAGILLAKYCGPKPSGVHVIVTARFARISQRYRSLAYSLVLRNAGCLLQTMYLVATALGRAPCAIGAGDADLFGRIAGLPYEVQGSVADFVLK